MRRVLSPPALLALGVLMLLALAVVWGMGVDIASGVFRHAARIDPTIPVACPTNSEELRPDRFISCMHITNGDGKVLGIFLLQATGEAGRYNPARVTLSAPPDKSRSGVWFGGSRIAFDGRTLRVFITKRSPSGEESKADVQELLSPVQLSLLSDMLGVGLSDKHRLRRFQEVDDILESVTRVP